MNASHSLSLRIDWLIGYPRKVEHNVGVKTKPKVRRKVETEVEITMTFQEARIFQLLSLFCKLLIAQADETSCWLFNASNMTTKCRNRFFLVNSQNLQKFWTIFFSTSFRQILSNSLIYFLANRSNSRIANLVILHRRKFRSKRDVRVLCHNLIWPLNHCVSNKTWLIFGTTRKLCNCIFFFFFSRQMRFL